jgi:hypothetical protein
MIDVVDNKKQEKNLKANSVFGSAIAACAERH